MTLPLTKISTRSQGNAECTLAVQLTVPAPGATTPPGPWPATSNSSNGPLLLKVFPRLSVLGQLPMAYLVGVGAAVAVGGTITGTLLPQIEATIEMFDLRNARYGWFYALFSGVLIIIGVLGTLAYFHFSARKKDDGSIQRNALIVALTWIGRFYIAISLGVLFAGVYLTALTAFISRVDSFGELIDALGKLFQSNASFIG